MGVGSWASVLLATPARGPGMLLCDCHGSCWEGRDRKIPGASLLGESQAREKDHLKQDALCLRNECTEFVLWP